MSATRHARRSRRISRRTSRLEAASSTGTSSDAIRGLLAGANYPRPVVLWARKLAALAAAVLAGMLAVVLATVAPAHAQTVTTPLPPPPLPKSWIVVDADSGAVIDAGNDRAPVPAASVFKLFTALLTVENLKPHTPVPISTRAEGMPARKINVKAGQVWDSDDLLHALLLVSANDAAVALAERLGGSEQGFADLMVRTAKALGLSDSPVLLDPAGLDDEFSYLGGNRISARDLAIITRAAMSYPQIMSIVALPDYRFQGGDGNGHRLLNHNRFLKTYQGAVGMKTGYTKKAGHTFIGAARRGDRTCLAVVLNAPDYYRSAAGLLDSCFATPVAALVDKAHLPEVVIGPGPVTPEQVGGTAKATTPETVAAPTARVEKASASTPWYDDPGARTGALAVLGGAPALLILVKRARRRAHPPTDSRSEGRKRGENASVVEDAEGGERYTDRYARTVTRR
jgi:D-alanyl-D-alanine carboxypeptidase